MSAKTPILINVAFGFAPIAFLSYPLLGIDPAFWIFAFIAIGSFVLVRAFKTSQPILNAIATFALALAALVIQYLQPKINSIIFVSIALVIALFASFAIEMLNRKSEFSLQSLFSSFLISASVIFLTVLENIIKSSDPYFIASCITALCLISLTQFVALIPIHHRPIHHRPALALSFLFITTAAAATNFFAFGFSPLRSIFYAALFGIVGVCRARLFSDSDPSFVSPTLFTLSSASIVMFVLTTLLTP